MRQNCGIAETAGRTKREKFEERWNPVKKFTKGNPTTGDLNSIPAKGLRIFRDVETKGLGRDAASAVLVPEHSHGFKWKLVHSDGGQDYFETSDEALHHIQHHFWGYEIEKRNSASKRNPADVSAEVFEEFHGYPASEIVKVKRDRHHHEHLAAAGELVGLRVKPVGHGLPVRTIEGLGKSCFLAFNEAKNQLFIEGGDQALSWDTLQEFGIETEHELQTIGKLVGVSYETDKSHLGDEGGHAIYSHTFRTTNENGVHITVRIARYPDLIYRVLDEQFEISGGDYDIKREGIDK